MSDFGDSGSHGGSSSRGTSPSQSGRSEYDSSSDSDHAKFWTAAHSKDAIDARGKLILERDEKLAAAKTYNAGQLQDLLTLLNSKLGDDEYCGLRNAAYGTLAEKVPTNLTSGLFEDTSDPFITFEKASEAEGRVMRPLMSRVEKESREDATKGNTTSLYHTTWCDGSLVPPILQTAAKEEGLPDMWKDLADSRGANYQRRWVAEIRRRSFLAGLKGREEAA